MGHFLAASPQRDAGDGQFGEIIRKADQMLAKNHKHVVSTVLHLDIGSILVSSVFFHIFSNTSHENAHKIIAVPLYKRYTCDR